MTTLEIECKLSELFCHGQILQREVRLTAEEAGYLQETGSALLSPLAGEAAEGPSSCLWYNVQFKGAFAK